MPRSMYRRAVILVILLALVFSAVLFRSSFDKIIILLLVGFAYLSGLISLFFGIIFSFLTYLASLPLISTIHSYIAFLLSKIHYIVFRIFVDKVLRRTRWFNKIELHIKNSSIVKQINRALHDFLTDLGLKSPRKIKFFEVSKCKSCERDIPVDGNFCPYCGDKIENIDSREAVFQSQFEDFYFHIKDLVGLRELINLSNYPGHRHFGENTERLRHSYTVSWFSYKFALRLGLDKRLIARAGLLHDVGYEVGGEGAISQILLHAMRGEKKVRDIGEDGRVGEIVSQHMFPLGKPPTSLEAWAVWTADKLASIMEFFRLESLFKGDKVWAKIEERTLTNS